MNSKIFFIASFLLFTLFVTAACGSQPERESAIVPVEDWIPLVQNTHSSGDDVWQFTTIELQPASLYTLTSDFLLRNFPRFTPDGTPTYPEFFGGMRICDETGVIYVDILEGSEGQAGWLLHFLATQPITAFEADIIMQTVEP